MTVRENMGFSLKIAGAAAGRDRRGASPRRRRSSASSRCWSAGPRSFPAASASASPWAAPSCATPTSSCSTSRSPTSTPSCARQMRTEIKKLHAKVQLDGDLRHPRPGRGDDAGRPHRHHARRLHRAGRHAGRGVPPPGDALRRRLHRLAADEPATRRRSTTAGWLLAAAPRCRCPAQFASSVDGRPARWCSGCGPTTSTRPAMACIRARPSEVHDDRAAGDDHRAARQRDAGVRRIRRPRLGRRACSTRKPLEAGRSGDA